MDDPFSSEPFLSISWHGFWDAAYPKFIVLREVDHDQVAEIPKYTVVGEVAMESKLRRHRKEYAL